MKRYEIEVLAKARFFVDANTELGALCIIDKGLTDNANNDGSITLRLPISWLSMKIEVEPLFATAVVVGVEPVNDKF